MSIMISIIVPVFNEAQIIKQTLDNLPFSDDIEVIVVDGGSNDNTVKIASSYPVKIIKSDKKRSLQMNIGAKEANGKILLFLHADCVLENGTISEINKKISSGAIGGCLTHKINSIKTIYRCIEKSGDIRARLFKVFYGDQAIFIEKKTFDELNGFNDVELFEDVLFSKKMNKKRDLTVLNKKVFSSARRWEKQGIIKTTIINWILSIGFIIGINPIKLKKLYLNIR